jgi:hypothetical protein
MVDAVTVEDIDVWDANLAALTGGLGWLFARPEPRETFGLIVRAMLAEVGKKNCPGYAHTLLIRQATTPKFTKKHPEGIYEVEYFLAHHRVGVPVPKLIAAAGLRWNIEDDNKAGKDQLGFGDYQVRKWTPWYRHVTISMLAHAFLAVTRANLGKGASNSDGPPPPRPGTP